SNAEHQILLGLKQHWGRNSSALSRWNLTSAAHCNWGGVSCTNGMVTAISLPNQFLAKPIPPFLCFLKNLTHLDLSYNFSTAFPITLYNCSTLNYLDISNNLFVGQLPDDINTLPAQLKHLNLSTNRFTGKIPPSIGWLPRLKSLLLDTNRFDGSYPAEEISNLANLEVLTLAQNPFDPSPIPEKFDRLTHLTYLWLSNMNITGEIPESLSNLSNLNMLALSSNYLQGTIPTWIWQLQKLKKLYIYDNDFTAVIATNITALNLVEIDMSTNQLTGRIPDGFGSVVNLAILFLYNNQLHGLIPPSIGLLPNLADIRLFSNKLSGPLPSELGKHSALGNIEVSNNNLSGELPEGLCFNKKLYDIVVFNNSFSGKLPESLGISQITDLDLSRNQITGSIPMTIGVLNGLNALNLSGNQISGNIPAAFGFMSVLTILDLSSNALSGEIPKDFNKLKLNILNLSRNQLIGEIPTVLQIDAYDLRFNPGLCVPSNSSIHSFSMCRAGTHFSNDLSRRLIVLFSVLASIIVLVSAVGGFLLLIRRQKHKHDPLQWKLTPFHALHFTEHDILSGLCEQNLIGSGRSGKVYRVYVTNGRDAGRIVAVKKIWKMQNLKEDLEKDFLAEIQILGEIRHTNIVKLLCCISSSEVKLLVYEYMENGSLDSWLHQRERIGVPAPLDWALRLRIAIDSARGLCYMHHGCSPAIVHRDVKSANILLDPEFRAKIADFGLARILLKAGDPESVSAIGGTFGYMPPEYGYWRKVNEKVDVYSFGVVLLELTTGKVANGGGAEYSLAQWAWREYQENSLSVDIIDEEIQDPKHNEDILAVFTLAIICTGEQPSMRPSMKDVLHALLRFDHRPRGGSLQHTASEEVALCES
ncbi:hypothetical protein EJB05_24906, partial [Eragrostis curvula]